MVKEECMYLSPERTPNISSPSVAKSQPNIAEKSDVQNPNTPTVPEDPLSPSSTSLEQGDHSETKESLQEEERTGSVPSMEETYNLANLFVSHQESQYIQKGAGIAPSLFTVVCHSEEHNMTPAMDGEDEIYNLESLFAGVSPPEKQRTDLEAESPSDAVMTPDIDGVERQATPKGQSGHTT